VNIVDDELAGRASERLAPAQESEEQHYKSGTRNCHFLLEECITYSN
jgi:hypothetical protein